MKGIKVIGLAGIIVLISASFFYWQVNYNISPSITELTEAQAPKEDSLSSRVIARTDLPPEGTRSLFDHIVANNDGLPYPFDKFIDLLKETNPDGAEPLSVLMPRGRSLLKGQTDELHPRIVLAADFYGNNTSAGLGISTQGQLFMGFVEEANEIEVLSYNAAAGRFEFQLVQNYCEGCIPKIVYARRDICLTCHQGGGPIFPQRPWNETNGQLATAALIKQARGTSEPYFGVALEQPLAKPERIDELTDVGNFYVASQRLWLDGCGETGNECRRKTLSLALQYADQPGFFDTNSEEANALRQLLTQSFPKSGIEVPESDIKNRDPNGESDTFSEWLHNLFAADFKKGDGAKNNEDLTAFEQLPDLPASLDPLTKRPPKQLLFADSIDGVYGIARFFTDADIDTLNQHFGYKLDKLLSAVADLPDSVFDPKPFSRVAMMRAILGKDMQYCCLDTSEMSPPQLSGVPELEIVKLTELKNFELYCFSCHRGNPSKRLNFMAGETEQEVLDSIQSIADIREALDWERYHGTSKASVIMPPTDSVQYSKLQEAGPEVREEMRESVPSMFGF